MRVLFLTNLPSPYRVKFFTELGKLCELTVLYERKSASDRDIEWKENSGNTYKEIYLKGLKVGTDNSLCINVIKYLGNHYDQIIIGMYSTYTAMIAILWMKLKGIPYCISTDGGFIKNESPIKKKLKTFLISSAKFWMGTGQLAKKYLKYYGAVEKNIYDYPFTSIDEKDILKSPVQQYEKDEQKRKLGLSTKFLVISVGQFIERKGFDVLLHAIKQIRKDNLEILIIGGSEQQFRKNICEQIPDNVKILPFMKKSQLFEYYKAADIFVLPTREDVWGLVVNEAMACGLPVITTKRCGAGVELIRDGINGFVLDSDDAETLSQKILAIMGLGEKVRSWQEYSLNIIKNYTFQAMAKKSYEILSDNLRSKTEKEALK